MMVLVVSINNSCGFVPLHNHPNSMDIFKNIRIRSDNTFIAFLIKEALEEKAPFRESAQIALSLKPVIKNSYGVITKENEITRYSVTLDVEYSLSSIKKNKLLFMIFYLVWDKKLMTLLGRGPKIVKKLSSDNS